MSIFKRDKIIDLEAELIHETDRAWLLGINGEEVWLPKSLVEYNEQDKVVTLPERIAIDKGLV
jgi:hypothetical protein